jgi:ribosomal-protein-alanine N-acetyltransferase
MTGRPPATIRPATAADQRRLEQLESLSFGVEAWPAAMVAAELAAPDRRYFAAEADGQVIGYAGIFLGPPAAEVMTVAVDPAARGRGVGRALMNVLLAAARQAGLREVRLTVAEGLEPATSLYRSLGFEPVGRLRGYYQPSGRDGLVLRARLPALPGGIVRRPERDR